MNLATPSRSLEVWDRCKAVGNCGRSPFAAAAPALVCLDLLFSMVPQRFSYFLLSSLLKANFSHVKHSTQRVLVISKAVYEVLVDISSRRIRISRQSLRSCFVCSSALSVSGIRHPLLLCFVYPRSRWAPLAMRSYHSANVATIITIIISRHIPPVILQS